MNCVILPSVLLAMSAGWSLARASTITVPTDYPTIQQAIDAAVSGDTVLVLPGTYVERINFGGKAITVASSQGAAVTTIDAGALGSTVTFAQGEGAAAVLAGFTIKNGTGTGLGGYQVGGGIVCLGSSPTIRDNVVTANHADRGAGLYGDAAPGVVQNQFVDNAASNAGGGVYADGAAVVDHNQFVRNTAQEAGGGVYSTRALITANVFEANRGGANGGGGIACHDTTIVAGNVLFYNRGTYGGGIDATEASVIVANVLWQNEGTAGGGGIACVSSRATIVNNLVFSNQGGLGAGIYCEDRNPLIRNTTIVKNTGSLGGGVLGGMVESSILWLNVPDQAHQVGSITYSDVQGGFAGIGNIDADPQFVNPSASNYRLQLGSPCVDAGDPLDKTCGRDLASNPRRLDGHLIGHAYVDMGCYELGHVHVDVSGAATPGGQLTIETSGTSGMPVVLLVGTAPDERCVNPFGPIFISLASPWLARGWGKIPSSIDLHVPASLPVPFPVVFQEIALSDTAREGNTSSVALTIE
ncbi:MAG: hypothetical protein U1E76_14020 [Planctomycetota bacterium]